MHVMHLVGPGLGQGCPLGNMQRAIECQVPSVSTSECAVPAAENGMLVAAHGHPQRWAGVGANPAAESHTTPTVDQVNGAHTRRRRRRHWAVFVILPLDCINWFHHGGGVELYCPPGLVI